MKKFKFEIGDFCIMTGALTRIDTLRNSNRQDDNFHRGTAVFEFSDYTMPWNIHKEDATEYPREFVKLPSWDDIYNLFLDNAKINITKASIPFWNDFAKWLCKRYL